MHVRVCVRVCVCVCVRVSKRAKSAGNICDCEVGKVGFPRAHQAAHPSSHCQAAAPEQL